MSSIGPLLAETMMMIKYIERTIIILYVKVKMNAE